MIIRGNTVCTNMPRTDYLETDPSNAAFLLNSPREEIRTAKEAALAALPRSGGTMTGDISMGGKMLTGLADPVSQTDAVTKQYVDSRKAAASVSLPAALGAGNTQTVAVSGVTPANHVLVTPAPQSHTAYTDAAVRCTTQGQGTLTFACDRVPEEDLTANILIFN